MKLFFWRKKTEKAAAEAKTPKKPKSVLREWLDALGFAAVAAILIRTFLVEAYMIPSGSMERSLMVGDFLFVSKLHYGIRLPMTPFALPFVHNKLPGTHTPSFTEWVRFPYYRLPGFTDVQRGDVFVFNYPADDALPNDPELGPVNIPSLKENYIKRCVAIAGDTLVIDSARIFINGKLMADPPEMQLRYRVQTNGEGFNPIRVAEFGYRDPLGPNPNWYMEGPDIYTFEMTREMAANFKAKFTNIQRIEPKIELRQVFTAEIYPKNPELFKWNQDYMGPIVIPAKGMTIELNEKNVAIYQRCIVAYERHTLEGKPGAYLIDGKPATNYTFEMNYYFGMGDNRHSSLDSRFWGFVPEDHIVGKPLFVFMNLSEGRFFRSID